mmetsp:Transcript_23012/g.55819  ORF Transcript_23012/g.55819 Transcript_23012/m.55819 type:complete len:250 (-) Transcript_23012:698-1447(-)
MLGIQHHIPLIFHKPRLTAVQSAHHVKRPHWCHCGQSIVPDVNVHPVLFGMRVHQPSGLIMRLIQIRAQPDWVHSELLVTDLQHLLRFFDGNQVVLHNVGVAKVPEDHLGLIRLYHSNLGRIDPAKTITPDWPGTPRLQVAKLPEYTFGVPVQVIHCSHDHVTLLLCHLEIEPLVVPIAEAQLWSCASVSHKLASHSSTVRGIDGKRLDEIDICATSGSGGGFRQITVIIGVGDGQLHKRLARHNLQSC